MPSLEQRRQKFGDQLSLLKGTLSGRAMAARLRWPQSKVSKILTGKQTPTQDDVKAWLTEVDAAATDAAEVWEAWRELRQHEQAWKHQVRRGVTALQNASRDRELNATRLRVVEFAVVPGLLQTAEFARHIITAHATIADVEVVDLDDAVKARHERQAVLYQGKDIDILIGHAALTHPAVPAPIMLGQLDRLRDFLAIPGIRIGIVPPYQQLAAAPINGFWIIDNLVVTEMLTGESEIADPDQVAAYHRFADSLWEVALTGIAARTALSEIIEHYLNPDTS